MPKPGLLSPSGVVIESKREPSARREEPPSSGGVSKGVFEQINDRQHAISATVTPAPPSRGSPERKVVQYGEVER